MFCRRSFFERIRTSALVLAAPSIAAICSSRWTVAGESKQSGDSAEGFRAMPWDHPPYGAPPLTFGERCGITILAETKRELIRSMLPRPLELDVSATASGDGAVVMLQQYLNTITHPLRVSYPNATVIVPAILGDKPGFYMARIYEGSNQATMLSIWGREIWGFPKVAAETNVLRKGKLVTAFVRAAFESMDVVVSLTDQEETVEAGSLSIFCRKTIPSPDNSGPDIDRIIEAPWRYTSETHIPAKVEKCDLKLAVNGKLNDLPVIEVLDAFWCTQGPGTILDKGSVLYDYLA